LSESEQEAAGAQPKVEGTGESGGAQRGGGEQPGKQIATAYYSVVTVVGALGGVSAFVGPFAKGGPGLIVLTVALVVILVLLDVGVRWLAGRLEKPITTSVRALGGVVVLALAVGAGGGYVFWHHSGGQTTPGADASTRASSGAGASAVSAPSSGVTSPSAGCAKPLAITSPTNGTRIVGSVGVKVGITACGLTPGETGWLFDYDPGSGTYGLDGDGGPILTGDQTMTFDDAPVGDPGDVNEYTDVTLVLANSSCDAALRSMNLENTQPTSLPMSCQIASQAEVVETWQ